MTQRQKWQQAGRCWRCGGEVYRRGLCREHWTAKTLADETARRKAGVRPRRCSVCYAAGHNAASCASRAELAR